MFSSKLRQRFRKMFETWATAEPPRPKLRSTFKLRLEVLEGRELLNGDLLIWNPSDGTNLASHAANWWDNNANNGMGQQGVEAAGIGNGVGCQVQLSTAKSNAPIIWNQSANVSNILLNGGGGAGGGGGYT